MSFTLATDTSCDVFRADLKARGIVYKPLSFIIDGEAYDDEFTSDAEYKGFYDKIRNGKMPTTSQINLAEHEEFFETLVKSCDNDILYLTLSSGLSGSYATACAAAKNIKEKTDRNIYVVDSLGATIATRIVLDEAERLRDSGVSAEAAQAELAEFVKHIHTWFTAVDLMHLKRGGRVSGPMAYLGTALNIKPVLFINKVGGLSVVQKTMGVSKAIAAMASHFEKDSAKQPHKFYIASADAESTEELLLKAKSLRPDCEGEIGWIGPVIGAHTGCGAFGISFLSETERQI